MRNLFEQCDKQTTDSLSYWYCDLIGKSLAICESLSFAKFKPIKSKISQLFVKTVIWKVYVWKTASCFNKRVFNWSFQNTGTISQAMWIINFSRYLRFYVGTKKTSVGKLTNWETTNPPCFHGNQDLRNFCFWLSLPARQFT